MDSLIFELQIVFYFQLFLSANVRHSSPSNVPLDSKTAHPSPRAYPRHSTGVLLHTVENLTQHEVCPVGHLTLCQNSGQSHKQKRLVNSFCIRDSKVIASIFTVLLGYLRTFKKAP